MIRVTNEQVSKFLAGYDLLEGEQLDNERGMVAAELYTLVHQRGQAYLMRSKSLQKERQKMVEDHALKDGKGNKEYANPTEPDPNKRILLWRDPDKWQRAWEAWDAKRQELDDHTVEVDAAPLSDDFFTKPEPLKVKQAVRTGFLPFMAKAQAAKVTGPVSKGKRR